MARRSKKHRRTTAQGTGEDQPNEKGSTDTNSVEPKKIEPSDLSPPRPNRSFLISSITAFSLWLLFLVVMAFFSGS